MKRLVPALLVAALAAAAAQAQTAPYQGHAYPWAAFASKFDGEAPVRLRGKIRSIDWSSPFAVITLEASEVSGGQGADLRRPGARDPDKTWRVFTASGIELKDKRIDPVALARGRDVVVRGYRGKDKSCAEGCIAQARDITFADGQRYYMSNTQAGPAGR